MLNRVTKHQITAPSGWGFLDGGTTLLASAMWMECGEDSFYNVVAYNYMASAMEVNAEVKVRLSSSHLCSVITTSTSQQGVVFSV